MFTMQRQFEAELTRLSMFWTAVEVVFWIAFFWALYAVVKAAVRDGINESAMGRRPPNRPTTKDDSPAMRAER